MEGKRSWWPGSWWDSMFNRIRKQVSSWEKRRDIWNEREEPSLTREMWGKTRPLGWALFVMVNYKGAIVLHECLSLAVLENWVIWLSIVSWGKEVLLIQLRLCENFFGRIPWQTSASDSVLPLLGLGSIPGWRTNILRQKKKRGPFFPGNPGGGRKRRTSQQEAVNLHEKYYVWFIVCQVNRWVVSATERGRETRSFWEDR